MRDEAVKKILEVGILLSAQRDLDRLLDEIVSRVMELVRCDGGTLYLREGGFLRFKIMRNRSMGARVIYSEAEMEDYLPPVPLAMENVCAAALLENRTIRVADVRRCGDYDFSGPIRYDAMTGYHTRSVLAAPVRNRDGEAVGVIQLINALDEAGNTAAFSEDCVLLLESVASQAGVAIQNARYIRQIKELFQSFVKVMSQAVDERSHYTGNHTRHMAAYGDRFLTWLNRRAENRGEPAPFPAGRREELLMSVWLHDVGKVATPLEVMDKAARLSPLQEQRLRGRLREMDLLRRLDRLEGRLSGEEAEALGRELADTGARLEAINRAGFVTDEDLAWLDGLGRRTYTDEEGQVRPWLTGEEAAMLSIRRGTLSPAERAEMERHVEITDRLLSQIRFSPELSHVRQWAASHHEFLSGGGYPRHLRGAEIPQETRIITILDIFEALTASDRPYKPGMPAERALAILREMAEREGKLDPALVELFAESRCWELSREEPESGAADSLQSTRQLV